MSTPSGLKTWLPSDVRKQQFVTDLLIELYEGFGYEPIVIPSIVDLSVVQKANVKFSADVFKLLDRDGKTLALRTELTQPIAKTIALRAEEIKFPIKLYYNSNIFRYKGIASDDSREIKQVGIEHFGSAAEENFSDHEICYLLIQSALNLGLTNFKVTITHSLIWKRIFELYEDASKAYNLVLDGDLVEFAKLSKTNSIYELMLQGAEISKFESLLDIDLSLLKSLLEDFSDYLVFDPLQSPDLNLYTGIFFNLYVEGEGKLVAMGGRYDNLCKSFGADLPAIGFAFYIPRLLNVMLRFKLLKEVESDFSYLKPKATWEETLKEASKLIHTRKKVFLKN